MARNGTQIGVAIAVEQADYRDRYPVPEHLVRQQRSGIGFAHRPAAQDKVMRLQCVQEIPSFASILGPSPPA